MQIIKKKPFSIRFISTVLKIQTIQTHLHTVKYFVKVCFGVNKIFFGTKKKTTLNSEFKYNWIIF